MYIYVRLGIWGRIVLFFTSTFYMSLKFSKDNTFSWVSFYTNPGKSMLLYSAYCKLHHEFCFRSLTILNTVSIDYLTSTT